MERYRDDSDRLRRESGRRDVHDEPSADQGAVGQLGEPLLAEMGDVIEQVRLDGRLVDQVVLTVVESEDTRFRSFTGRFVIIK